MKTIPIPTNKYWINTFIIGILTLFLFWQLGAFPNILDQNVDVSIHPQVNKVMDKLIIPGEITWLWQDMHQFEGGRSPLYGALIEFGLRLFGLTLFGIRIFPAIFSLITLILLYFSSLHFFPRVFSLIFLFLFSSSPWYLTLARSGGIVGFSLNLALISLCLIAMLIKRERKGLVIPFLAGVSLAVLPYGYAILRPLIPLLLLFVIINWRRVGKPGLIVFSITLLSIVSVQLIDLGNSLHHFFYARGESSYSTVIDFIQKKNINAPLQNIRNNLLLELKLLLGLNHPDNYWNPGIAFDLCSSDTVLYPKFLTPIFLLGFILSIFNYVRKKSRMLIYPVLFFFIAIFPSTIGSAVGGPCMGRDTLVLVPLYFFISLAIYQIYLFLDSKISKKYNANLKFTTITLLGLVAVISGYQLYNFFANGDIRGDRAAMTTINKEYHYLSSYFRKNPQAKILMQDFAPWSEYGAYTFIRLVGGKPFQNKLENGQIMLVRNENLTELSKLIKSNYFDIVITIAPNQLINKDMGLPELEKYHLISYDSFSIIDMKTSIVH